MDLVGSRAVDGMRKSIRKVAAAGFNLEAVRLIRDGGISCAQASQDLKVHPTQLRNW